MALDELTSKIRTNEQENHKEIDKLLQKRTHNVIRRAFSNTSESEASDNKGSGNRKKGIIEGAFDSLAMYIKTREKLIGTQDALTPQQKQHEKFGQQYETLLKRELREKEIEDIIQKRANEIIKAAGPDSNDSLLEAYRNLDIKLLDLPRGTRESSLTSEISSFSQRRIRESQSVPVSTKAVEHINATYASVFNRGFDKFYQEYNQDFLPASAHAHQVAFEFMYHRTRELAFYEKIDSFTQPETEQVKQEFDQQQRALEKLIGVPDIPKLIEELRNLPLSDWLTPEKQTDFESRYRATQDRSTYNDSPDEKLKQLDKLAEDIQFTIELVDNNGIITTPRSITPEEMWRK